MSPETSRDEAPAGLPLPLTGETRVFAILGDPIAQAGSPALFNAEFRRRGYPGVLVPMHVRPSDLEQAFRGLWAVSNLDGLVLTVPHKIEALRLVDELGPAARRMGAVNAVCRLPDNRLVGENFDGAGFVGGLRAQGHELAGRRVLIVGCGGAGSAVASAVADESPASLRLFDVDEARSKALASRIAGWHPGLRVAPSLPDPVGMDVIVNCTSLGMGTGNPTPVETGRLERGALAVDIVLKPEITRFLAEAAARGCVTHSGSHMLAAQVGAICNFFDLGAERTDRSQTQI